MRRRIRTIEDLVDALWSPTTPVIGLFGRGFPNSFYKVFVRTRSTWYTVESHYVDPTGLHSETVNPVRYLTDLWLDGRSTGVWFGQLLTLPLYEHIDGACLAALWAHAETLGKVGRLVPGSAGADR